MRSSSALNSMPCGAHCVVLLLWVGREVPGLLPFWSQFRPRRATWWRLRRLTPGGQSQLGVREGEVADPDRCGAYLADHRCSDSYLPSWRRPLRCRPSQEQEGWQFALRSRAAIISSSWNKAHSNRPPLVVTTLRRYLRSPPARSGPASSAARAPRRRSARFYLGREAARGH